MIISKNHAKVQIFCDLTKDNAQNVCTYKKKVVLLQEILFPSMQYSVVHLSYLFEEDWQKDLFEQSLCDIGFEAFDGNDAYIQTSILTANSHSLEALIEETEGVEIVSIEACEDANWNAAWEAEHVIEELPMGVRIIPHCAFGAGHHETTHMMIDAILRAKDEGFFLLPKNVLDMGCGTGVLAIMAKKCGATNVVAVDIDDKSVTNTTENALANEVAIAIRLASTPPDEHFDLVLANIHRNILIEQMPMYARILNTNGELWLSGFFDEDIPHLAAAATQVGLQHIETKNINEWQWMRLITK